MPILGIHDNIFSGNFVCWEKRTWLGADAVKAIFACQKVHFYRKITFIFDDNLAILLWRKMLELLADSLSSFCLVSGEVWRLLSIVALDVDLDGRMRSTAPWCQFPWWIHQSCAEQLSNDILLSWCLFLRASSHVQPFFSLPSQVSCDGIDSCHYYGNMSIAIESFLCTFREVPNSVVFASLDTLHVRIG